MIISDLCHLEEISEVSNLAGGLSSLTSYSFSQFNLSTIQQYATATATAYATGGSPAIASASAGNLAIVNQYNILTQPLF